MTAQQQYGRRLSLIVAQSNGKGIELGELRVVFTVRRGDTQTPNTLDARVYNLSAQTANLIAGQEFTQVALQVGYGLDGTGPLSLIFLGSIKQVRQGREDQKDSYVDITAADGDEAYNYSTVALSLEAGTSQAQTAEALIASMVRGASIPSGTVVAANTPASKDAQQLRKGYVPQLSQSGSVRGRVYMGLARDALRKFAADNDCIWSIQDGAVTLIPQTGYIPGAPVIISPQTGLIGVPEQTQNGLEMRVLLNPQVRIGRLVQLKDSAINQYRYGLDVASVKQNLYLQKSTTKLNAQGLYYVMRADHSGDTRGQPWYSDLTCLAVDATFPIDQVGETAIFPGSAITRY